MAFTRRHFEMIARVLKQTREAYATDQGNEGSMMGETITEVLARAFADEFARDNDRFDRSRFLKACGYPIN